MSIDYPEDEPEARSDGRRALDDAVPFLEGLTRTYRQGRIYQEGVTVAIAGATNAGKSSLFNLLLRQERAIVSEIHGTTRDWLEGAVSIEGIPVRLFDTAGLRRFRRSAGVGGHPPHRAGDRGRRRGGVRGGRQRGLSAADKELVGRLDGHARPFLRAWNKADLPGVPPAPAGFHAVSAVTGAGVEPLEKEIAGAVLGGSAAEAGEPLIDSERQRDLIAARAGGLGPFQRRPRPRHHRRTSWPWILPRRWTRLGRSPAR